MTTVSLKSTSSLLRSRSYLRPRSLPLSRMEILSAATSNYLISYFGLINIVLKLRGQRITPSKLIWNISKARKQTQQPQVPHRDPHKNEQLDNPPTLAQQETCQQLIKYYKPVGYSTPPTPRTAILSSTDGKRDMQGMQDISREINRIISSQAGISYVQSLASTDNNMQSALDRQPVTDEFAQVWVNQLEQWTNIFYNDPNSQNPVLWQDAQNKLVQFQKIHDSLELCTKIIKKTRNQLVLYQATLCLKNSIANDFKAFDSDELFRLFQFLYEFLCSSALENEMSINETAALICAMILKRLAGRGSPPNREEHDKISNVITTLCNHIKGPNESLSNKVASTLMLNSLLLECQMTNRSTSLGLRVWKHMVARQLIETHLKPVAEVCLETINWAFTSNLLNPASQTRETQILFHLVGSLIQCVEYALSFNSFESGCATSGDRILRVIQSRTINMMSHADDTEPRRKALRDWCELVMTPSVIQFLFDLYITIKSMVNCVPGWNWPSNTLKNCLNCLNYMSDVHYSISVERNDKYADFVGNLMVGAVKIMNGDVKGIDDSYQIACLITSISMHISETRETLPNIKAEHFIPFIDTAQTYTCKVFTQVAKASKIDEEEEEEKTVDTLLDFWYHVFRNIESEIRRCEAFYLQPKVSTERLRAYSRVIVESYISCHLREPLGQVVQKSDEYNQEVDLDHADEQDDNSIHAQQLISFGMIARFDSLHTAKLLIELFTTRIAHLESLLTQCIATKASPEGLKDWEYINDDLHWLLLMLEHFLTQTGYGEIGFMCAEILSASVNYKADTQKTLEGFQKCDYSSPDVDPIVRLVMIVLKLCQIEIGICQSGNINWLSSQTNATLTTLLSRFCLTYLYPKESDYSIISENMNNCFGQDSETAEKFLKFVVEHTCCIIMYMKADQQIVKKNVQLLIQLIMFHPHVKEVIADAEETSMTKMFLGQMRPDNLTGFSPRVAKSIIKLATRLFSREDDWIKLIEFFTNKWSFIMSCIQTRQHQSELVSTKFLEFCDFTIGVCEACDDETSERLFEQLLVPIVKALPTVLQAFGNFETVPTAVFELLYYIVKMPLVNIATWESQAAKSFYDSCKVVIDSYAQLSQTRKDRGAEEEDCEDIIALLTFSHEVMKRDWGNTCISCDEVVRFSMEKLSAIVKPEYLQFPRVRTMYYRLLVYLVDDDDRLANLSDILLTTIVKSIFIALNSKFDKDVDNHTYTIISIVCRTIDMEKGNPISERLSQFMKPVFPCLFNATINQGSFTINTETAEMVAPALFSLRCCFPEIYQSLVKDLIESQTDTYAQSKIKSLFESLESKINRLTLNRAACRTFNNLFVPFLAELHNYVTTK